MPKLFHVRWSAINTWRKCQQKYHYSWEQNLERVKPPVPLIRGTILGKCLDEVAENRSPNPVLKQYQREYDKLFREEKAEYGDIIEECRRMISNYKSIYARDGLTYLPGKNGEHHEIEVETRFKLGSLNVRFTGHIDKVVRNKQGIMFVMDHKSHKNLPDENARFNDLQLITYLWLLPLSGFEPADGVLWDYIRTKPPTIPELLKDGGLSQRKSLDTDYDTYLATIKENGLDPRNYKEILAKLKVEGSSRFFRRVYLPNPGKELIRNAVNDFKRTITQIHEVSSRGDFVRNAGRDCSWCPFYELCSAEFRGLDTSFIMKHSYKERDDDKA